MLSLRRREWDGMAAAAGEERMRVRLVVHGVLGRSTHGHYAEVAACSLVDADRDRSAPRSSSRSDQGGTAVLIGR